MIVQQFMDDPAAARASCAAMIQAHALLRVPFTEAWQLYDIAVKANAGDAPATASAMNTLLMEFRHNGVDGGLEVLLVVAILAWRLGDANRARRYFAAYRRSGQLPNSLGIVSVSRRLRDAINLEPLDPTGSLPLAEIVAEALSWLHTAASASS